MAVPSVLGYVGYVTEVSGAVSLGVRGEGWGCWMRRDEKEKERESTRGARRHKETVVKITLNNYADISGGR